MCCSSWVAAAAFEAGAVIGNDISGFADPDYLAVAANAGASVVATHIRLAPRVADPDPVYDDVVADVATFLQDRAARAEAAGIPPQRIVLDAGLDLGKTWQQSLALLRASPVLAGLGHPLLLSASNKTFLGRLLDLDVGERREASHAIGVIGGCRILRVHDVRGARRDISGKEGNCRSRSVLARAAMTIAVAGHLPLVGARARVTPPRPSTTLDRSSRISPTS